MSKEPIKQEEEVVEQQEVVVNDDAVDEAAFASGFSGKEEENKEEVKDENKEEVEAKTEEVVEEKVEEPKYVQLTQADFETLKAGAAKASELEGKVNEQFRKAFGTMGSLKQAIDKISNTKGDIDMAALEDMEKAFPELGEQMRRILVKQGKIENEPGESPKQEGMSPESLETLFKQREEKKISEEIAEEHPDWVNTVGAFGTQTPFRVWLSKQGEAYETKINRTRSPRLVIEALDKFEADRVKAPPAPSKEGVNKGTQRQAAPPSQRTPNPQARRDLLREGVNPRGSGVTPPRPKSELDHFTDGFTQR